MTPIQKSNARRSAVKVKTALVKINSYLTKRGDDIPEEDRLNIGRILKGAVVETNAIIVLTKP